MKHFKLLAVILIFNSCGGVIEKQWAVNNFNEPQSFSLSTKKGQNVTGARTFIDGNFTGTIYLSTVRNDSTLSFTEKDLPSEGILSDFYGGTFKIFLAKSDAKGEIFITIKIPYN